MGLGSRAHARHLPRRLHGQNPEPLPAQLLREGHRSQECKRHAEHPAAQAQEIRGVCRGEG
eukprot:2733640-Heterocapsa_arctica.AAC.1